MGSQELRECPFCKELIKEAAIKCHHCKSWISFGSVIHSPWYRCRDDVVISGICAGLARKFDLDVTLVRLAFLLLAICGGHGVLIYIVLRLLMPLEPDTTQLSFHRT